MRRLVILLFCLSLILSSSACSKLRSESDPEPSQPATAQPAAPTPAVPEQPAQTAPQTPVVSGGDSTNLSQKGYDWYYRRNTQHLVPGAAAEALPWLTAHNGFYVLPNTDNTIYLTFDCGYELGYTSRILDILKQHDVKAAFFITGQYIKTQPELVKRMHREGHLVCNHTWNHPDMTTLTQSRIKTELDQVEQSYLALTGVPLDRYLRPPMGRYSEASLAAVSQLGYKTVFWSLAFKDWDPNQQPGAEAAYKEVINYVHSGAVILLHAVSKSDTEALDRILTDLAAQGYGFATFH